ncbi:metalloreductase STEAP4-like [Oratosquilla oratoria]|uniref:metalloreductase STEAP4-like n=1 Tax=Oratosquilla oratoria TaxID=337810 RepID=UPI003F76F94F
MPSSPISLLEMPKYPATPPLGRTKDLEALEEPTTLCKVEDDAISIESSLSSFDYVSIAPTPNVVVLGSGDFGRALARRLRQAGYSGVVATRHPERNRQLVESCGGKVGSYGEVLPGCNMVVLAVPHKSHHKLPFHLLQNKILVDVSNRNPTKKAPTKSNAEKLQELFPLSHVVKAFNTLPAYALERGAIHGSREVPICGDHMWARGAVAQVIRDLGFQPVDHGDLRGASHLEDLPHRFFSEEWRFVFKLTSVIFACVWIFFLLRFQLCRGLTDGDWDFSCFKRLPLGNTKHVIGVVAITELALIYLADVIAAYVQLWRGTKYSHFPNWLDLWLRSRKQIGLFVLLLGTIHGCMAALALIPRELDFSWHEELYLAAGAILLGLLIILGVTSLPFVAASMTWKEFTFVQSKLGWLALFVSFLHVLFFSNVLQNDFRCYVLPKGSQLSILLPAVTLFLKVFLLVPWVGNKLSKIRRGHVRLPPKSDVPV